MLIEVMFEVLPPPTDDPLTMAVVIPLLEFEEPDPEE